MIKMKKVSIALVALSMSLTAYAQNVTVDNYYNRETRKTKDGRTEAFHYLWTDREMSGFSILGDIFLKNGARALTTLAQAPTMQNLKKMDVYIIVDPDHLGDSPSPNYMDEKSAQVIADWVKAGGVLLLMGNDEANADLKHFNILTAKFGFTFNSDIILGVKDDEHFDDGGLSTSGNSLFKTSKYIFIKNAASIAIQHTAVPLLNTKDGKNAMVTVKYGKGAVLAVGDPWLYNEYTNGRLPARFENDKAAADVAQWLLEQAIKAK